MGAGNPGGGWDGMPQTDKPVYVHVLDCNDARVLVPLRAKVVRSRLLRQGSAVAIRKQSDGI